MEQVNLFISVGVQALVQCPLTVIIAVLKMKGNSTWMTAVAATAALITVITILLFLLSVKKTAMVQKLIDDVNRLTKEHLTGMRVVHAYNGYEYQKKQFEATNDRLMKTNVSANRYIGAIQPFFNVSVNALTLVIYILGSSMILSMDSISLKQQTFSQMVVFSSYSLQAFSAFAMILIVLTALPRLIISLRRIVEVIDTEVEITDGMAANGLNGKFGTIEFRHVSFTYPGSSEKALDDISFTVKKGETLAIIGSTGSGKTTLMNLIPRFYDATEGAVFVDGRNVIDYNLWALRDMIGYVPQKSFLFAGTIGSNIDYGQKSGLENTLSEIKKAAEIGQSKEFVERKQGQYEARVEEGGSNFSGGQRQRLTISRAVCRDPEFYLFDDSFSALDFKTDSILRRKLRENAKDSTQVIVGQRVGSIMDADCILVLDKGKIVGKGRHEELLKSCQVYREIALSQLMSEEVK
jgi:ATP-binding cassette subfamily B protein